MEIDELKQELVRETIAKQQWYEAYIKEKEKNKRLEQENTFLKAMYRGTDEFKAIKKFAKEE